MPHRPRLPQLPPPLSILVGRSVGRRKVPSGGISAFSSSGWVCPACVVFAGKRGFEVIAGLGDLHEFRGPEWDCQFCLALSKGSPDTYTSPIFMEEYDIKKNNNNTRAVI